MANVIELTLLRHGRSRADDEDVHEGSYDSPLTETGILHATELAVKWESENRHFDSIISSSLVRARRVAQIIGEKLDVPVHVSDQWKERDNGPLAGMKRDEAEKAYPKSDFVNPYSPLVTSANAGESMCELYCRASMAIQGIVRKGPGRYLVVSHGGFLNAVMNIIMGNQPKANEEKIIFMFHFLHSAQLRYFPDEDIWVVDRFSD
jgi:2,3-bisphosphoglycerate-dependent phosphoglycerate mutase